MKQVTLIQKISDLLIQFSKEVKDKGKLKLTDINIVSEDILVPILSLAYDTPLKNLNDEKSNFPGIDLATDEFITYAGTNKKIAFQITSTNDIAKIKKTLKQYVDKKFYEQFDEIYIYILTEKQYSYQKKSITEVNKIKANKFIFDLSKNIIDRTDLNTKITALTPVSKIETIHKLLQDQFEYRKKSLLSLDIWEAEGKIGYGFSNLINGLDITTFNTLIKDKVSDDVKDLIFLLLKKYNKDFSINYDQNEQDKFINLAFNTYLKAGFGQALSSYNRIKDSIESKINIESFKTTISQKFNKLTDIDESDFPLVNQPINHPAIKFIKETVQQLFTTCDISAATQAEFIKDFNQNIQNCIVNTFGSDDYSKHIEQTKDKWIRENELELLREMKNLSKLGFSQDEDLQYQETFGTWKDIRKYGTFDEDESTQHHKNLSNSYLEKILNETEDNLKKVESLIDEYFLAYRENKAGYLHNILFLLADFGKGKTSFLKYFASKLAKEYLQSHEGPIPVYLNLNEYDKYSNSPSLGAISFYLESEFRIDIKDEYFKKKDYFFLIDSLDECGELTEVNIEKVIKDIHEIQKLDAVNQRYNKMIVASRPISKGLKDQITKYRPYEIKLQREETKRKETTQNYISIYGFKKGQFDDYIEYALKNDINRGLIDKNKLKGFPKEIVEKIVVGKEIDLYKSLLNKVLKGSELKRPIFAYMIYKLIASNSNFIDFGKVGVYISFLNQLSRDAKHKDDINYEVTLKDEFIYRNILTASSLLWQYKRQSGEQTTLTKADICRTIENDEIDKDDRAVLNKFKDIDSINFLSHSYLGEKESTLHFQHQSFAEILLAEYYLKVFIKFAFEDNINVEHTRAMLSVGIPTDQTIEFLKGLVMLLKEATLGISNDVNTLEKRRLFIPLLSSLSITNHNKKLYSTKLDLKWFDDYKKEIFEENIIPEDAVKKFPINEDVFRRIEKLCINIINSTKVYFIGEASLNSLLFKNELIATANNIRESLVDIDKWYALMVGNLLVTDTPKGVFFNSKIEARQLFDMIKNLSNTDYFPVWANKYFQGIDMKGNTEVLVYSRLRCWGFDFSNSYLKRLVIRESNLNSSFFINSTFENFNLINCQVRHVDFNNITVINSEIKEDKNERNRSEGNFALSLCEIEQGIIFPKELNNILKGKSTGIVHYGSFAYFDDYIHDEWLRSSLFKMRGIFKYIIEKKKNTDIIFSSIRFSKKANAIPEHSDVKKTIEQQFRDFIEEIEDEIKAQNLLYKQ
jgi:hypothetical protein